jgi:hypothetical protein
MSHQVRCFNTGSNMFHCEVQNGTKLNPADLHEYYLNCPTECVNRADTAKCVNRFDNVFTVQVTSSGFTHLTNVKYDKDTHMFSEHEFDPSVVIPAVLSHKKNTVYFEACKHPAKVKNFKDLDAETSNVHAVMCEQRQAEAQARQELQAQQEAARRTSVASNVPTAPTTGKRVKKTQDAAETRSNNLED